ncbi:4-phosphopantetheinyl transferase [Sesbania bispinosa]|nr:4-phosphopantetheinyl transferase [Sesbania bispinosa]
MPEHRVPTSVVTKDSHATKDTGSLPLKKSGSPKKVVEIWRKKEIVTVLSCSRRRRRTMQWPHRGSS